MGDYSESSTLIDELYLDGFSPFGPFQSTLLFFGLLGHFGVLSAAVVRWGSFGPLWVTLVLWDSLGYFGRLGHFGLLLSFGPLFLVV